MFSVQHRRVLDSVRMGSQSCALLWGPLERSSTGLSQMVGEVMVALHSVLLVGERWPTTNWRGQPPGDSGSACDAVRKGGGYVHAFMYV